MQTIAPSLLGRVGLKICSRYYAGHGAELTWNEDEAALRPSQLTLALLVYRSNQFVLDTMPGTLGSLAWTLDLESQRTQV